MRQRKLGSHTPPCHRRMVITTLFNVMLAALQRAGSVGGGGGGAQAPLSSPCPPSNHTITINLTLTFVASCGRVRARARVTELVEPVLVL